MLETYLTVYPWDLLDEGVDAVLDRLVGEVGVTGLSLWAAVPPVVQCRIRDVAPRVVRSSGGLFFRPAEEGYEATRLKPAPSAGAKARDPLRLIEHACKERGLKLRAYVSACATGHGARSHHPYLACKNVFGDESQHAMCLANPDVSAYLCALLVDLSTHYSLAATCLADFQIAWLEGYRFDVQFARPLALAEQALLSMCFCESCRQKAASEGVEVAAAQRAAKVLLDRSLNEPWESRRESAPADAPPLSAYVQWRTRELSALLGLIEERCPTALLLDRDVVGVAQLPTPTPLRAADGVIVWVGDSQQAATIAPASTSTRTELRLSASWIARCPSTELVGLWSRWAQMGFAGVEIDHYGLLPESSLTAVKQAVRFARRTG